MADVEVVMVQRFAIGMALAGLLVGGAASAQQAKPAAAAPKKPAAPAGPVIVVETVKGTFEIQTYPEDAPKSQEHVLALVRDTFYRGHRIFYVAANAVQFGDPLTKNMTKRDMWGSGNSGHAVGVAETSKRKFDKGTVILYYRNDYPPKLADSQLLILKQANPTIEGKYAVIGKVSAGMDVVDKLEVTDVIKKMYVKGEAAK